MNLKEAYTILELSMNASPEEAKKRYRELSKKYHPDVNKDPEAETKFKKINEAYQCVQAGKGNDRENFRSSWGPSVKRQVVQLENVEVHTTISFKESVLGCKKEIKYSRQNKCSNCLGNGETKLNNGCKKCGGKGFFTSKNGGTVVIFSCNECAGRTSVEECKICSGNGTVHTDVSINVSIPGGVTNGSILRLQGMGNYAGSFMGVADQYTDAFCYITVTQESDLILDGKNVISHLTIPLLDALKGCTRTVKTILGDKVIKIDPQSRNCDEVIIPNHGVDGIGDQKVVLNVQYPENTDKLIDILSNEV